MRRLTFAILAFAIVTFAAAQNYYTTFFPLTENPISEGGNWVNGLAQGLHWGNMQTFAGGHVGATNTSPGCDLAHPNNCNDSVAALTGTWTVNQAACGVVFIDPTLNVNTTIDEVEIHLHRTIISGNSTGYEFDYSLHNNGTQYAAIVRWDGYTGGNNSFTFLSQFPGTPVALQNADLFCASAIGGNLKYWIERAGVVIQTAPATPVTDTTYTAGAPGLGAENGLGPLSDNAKFGFSSFTAANLYAQTPNLADISPLVQGPTHTAANGESIAIPPGKGNWTNATLTVPSGVGLQIIGAGLVAPASCAAGGPGTCITGSVASNIPILAMTPSASAATSRISGITWIPTVPYCTGLPAACKPGGGAIGGPISVNGTCSASTCPNLRIDNNFVPSAWANNGISDDTFANVTNMFGVADHNTVGDTAPGSNGVDFINVGHGQWLTNSPANYGDTSYATADTFGTFQAFYLEDNIFGTTAGAAIGTDTDVNGANGGGGRFVCRFNLWNNVSSGGACTGHGLDTTQRTRGLRQWEAYWNTLICQNTAQGCGSAWPGRSGVGISAANIFSNGISGSFFKAMASMDTQRRWRGNNPFGFADGLQPWDTNDPAGVFFTGTIATATNNNPNWTITLAGTPFTAGQWSSNGTPYSLWDTTRLIGAEIQSSPPNTTNSLVLIVPSPAGTFVAGDTFEIRRVLVAMDQATRGQGVLLNGSLASPAPVGPVNQQLDPTYEADDAQPNTMQSTIGANTASIIANRDFYVEAVRQAANNACGGVACTPFNGTSGSGHGLFANKPNCSSGPACLTGVGYWATDCPGATGCAGAPWNTSTGANAGKSGELFTWNGFAWVLHFEPAPYPHPLVTGAAPAPSPQVSFSPPTISFGSWPVGVTSSPAQTLTITNVGTANLTWTNFSTTQPGGTTFNDLAGGGTCAQANAGGLAPSSSCTVVLTGVTNNVGLQSGTFNFPSNAPGSPQTVPLSITGTGVPIASLSASSVNFNNVNQGGNNSFTITLTNTGTANLTWTSLAASGAPYSLSNTGTCATPSGSLAPAASCTIIPVFAPTTTGTFNGAVTLVDNAAGSPHVVTLTGIGVSVAPSTAIFALLAGIVILNGIVRIL